MTGASKKSGGPSQAALGLRLDDKTLNSLDRFYPGAANRLALDAARTFVRREIQKTLVITGRSKSGKTHMLRGIFHAWARARKENAYFIDAKRRAEIPPDISGQNPPRPDAVPVLVCIDDLNLPSGDPEKFYESVFNLFNRLSDAGGYMAVTMRQSPAKSPGVPDFLSSRLLTGMVVSLQRPGEGEMKLILGKMADDRSISLTPGARDFVLQRSGRSTGDLLELVDRLEAEMPPGSRRVGLQLLRRVIDWEES